MRILSVIDEFRKTFIHRRHNDVAEIWLNIIGAFLEIAICILMQKMIMRFELKKSKK